MNERAFSEPDAKILDVVNKAAALAPGQRIIVVFDPPTSVSTITGALSHPSVAGIIAPDEKTAVQFNDAGKVGYCFNRPATRWAFPKVRARAAVLVGGSETVGLGILRDALRQGISTFLLVDRTTASLMRCSLLKLSGELVVRTVARRANELVLWWTAFQDDVSDRIIHLIDRSRKFLDSREHIVAFRLSRMIARARRRTWERGSPNEIALVVIGSLSAGGSERQAVNTALKLSRAGTLRVILVCSRPGDGFYRRLLEDAGIEIIDLHKLDPGVAERARYANLFNSFSSDCVDLPLEFRQDVVCYLILFSRLKPKIVHSFLDENNVKAGTAAAIADVPRTVLSARSVAPDNFSALIRSYMRPGYKALLGRKKLVLSCNSRAGARDYRRWLRKPFLRIPIVYNGVDFEAFAARDGVDYAARHQWGVPSKALVVLSVMRFSEEKQPKLWADAAIEISRRQANVCFLGVGDGPLRGEMERILEQARTGGRVRLIPQTLEVPALLRASDLFLLTSRLEGLPNVLIEAQAVGVPVVTTPAGGAVETLAPGITGLIAPDQSVAAVANTCLRLLDDHELRNRMSGAAPGFVREKFSLERMLADTVKLYET